MKKLFIFLFVVLAACTELQPVLSDGVETVEVTFDFGCSALSKADSPLIPDVENLIYDVWILQYDKMGLLIDAGTSHERKTQSGSLTATVTTNLATGDDCTICVLANLDRGNPDAVRTWPQTLTEFKTSLSVVDLSSDITSANAGTLADMPMFGYWEGDITAEVNNIQVSLGRMLARMNLVINNASGSSCSMTSITNVPLKSYAFPQVNHEPLPFEAYSTVVIEASVASGSSKELYFYMAPNFTSGEANATRLNFSNGKSVILSNGAPDTANRDYNLYHNSNYTFTINLK